MWKYWFKIALCLLPLAAQAQALLPVPGLPTRELYDLHVDQKGYLWIAHDLGISRFDGQAFTRYSHPLQASQSMSNIIEDRQGRIWCCNLSGQIFYIQHNQLTLLTAFDYTKETQPPRLALCGDELLATTDHGLFICSTTDLKCRYLPLKKGPAAGQLSIGVLGHTAILFDTHNWYRYQRGRNVQPLQADTAFHFPKGNTLLLQPAAFDRALFLTANPSGIVYQVAATEHSVQLTRTIRLNDYINGMTVAGAAWIHTRNQSSTIDHQYTVRGQSITDMVIDKEGNTWFSSLKQGLMVRYRQQPWQLLKPTLAPGDFVRCLNATDGYFFGGTNRGNLVILDTAMATTTWNKALFDGYGSVDFIRYYRDHLFVVGTSVNTYVVDPLQRKIRDLLPLASVKDVDYDATSLYLATSNGVYIMPYQDSVGLRQWLAQKQQQFPSIPWAVPRADSFQYFAKRSHAIRYNPDDQSLFISFKDGLYQVDQNGAGPLRLGGKNVFASSLWYRQHKLFVATFNEGIWVKDGSRLNHITTNDMLSSNTILRTKATRNHLWLFENEGLQVLDMRTEKLLQNNNLPRINGANAFDVAEWGGYGYITTAEGVYKIPLSPTAAEPAPQGYLDAIVLNNKDTLSGPEAMLPYPSNDLQFFFSVPAFTNPAQVSFRYRLAGADDDWRLTSTGERMLRFVSLRPGSYRFEAVAVNENGQQQQEPIVFRFTILKPFWQTGWFIGLVVLLAAAISYALYRTRLRQALAVEAVRRNIASDLHDDIGATLSSINIYTSLARVDKDNDAYLNTIQGYATEVVGKLDDLVWSVNPGNDSFPGLMQRMQAYAQPLLQARQIDFEFLYDEALTSHRLHVKMKQHLYLVFKELVNNVAKHSGATLCTATLQLRGRQVFLQVADDGVGFHPYNVRTDRNGLVNTRERARKMNGHVFIQSRSGEGTQVGLSAPLG
jgi:signal transduction histidine kinase/ligand-binding sensor domain-containing protein